MTSVILNGFTVPTYTSFAVFPTSAADGSLAVDLSTDKLYEFDEPTASWILIGPGSGGSGVAVVTASGPLASSGGTNPNITIQTASATQAGALSATDWSTFNAKQPAGSYITSLTGDVTAAGPGSSAASLTATTNATITTLSALSLPGSQVSGNISGNAANITSTSNSTLTSLPSLSLPGSQVSGNIPGNAANITATSNSTLTSLPDLSLPGSQVSGNISGNATNITATSNSTLTTLSSLSLPGSQVSGNITGNAANITGTVAIANGGTGQTTQQAAINALAGAVTSAQFLRGNGTNVTMSAIQVADVPTLNQNTTGTASNITATSNSTLTTLSSLSLPTTQLSGQVTLSQLPSIAADTFLANGTGSTATPTALTTAQVNALLPAFTGDSGSGGVQGLVPAPAAGTALKQDFLSASGSFVYVDQSKPEPQPFTLISQTPTSVALNKINNVLTYTAVNGRQYAVIIGVAAATLAIFDVTNQASPVLMSTIATLQGAYNAVHALISGVDYIIVASSGGYNLYIINVSNPSSMSITTTFNLTSATGSTYNIAYQNGYVYLACQSVGLKVVDIGGGLAGGTLTSPVVSYTQGSAKSFGVAVSGTNLYTTQYSTSPYATRLLNSWSLTGSGTAAVPVAVQSLTLPGLGETLAVSINATTAFVSNTTGVNQLDIVDITNPASMSNLTQVTMPSGYSIAAAMVAIPYGNYLFMPIGSNATYGGAIAMYDITNRSSPILVSLATTNVATSPFGGISIFNGYIFAGDYGPAPGSNGTLDIFTLPLITPVFGGATGSTLILQSLTPNTAIVTNSSNQLISSSTTATELGYVHGVTSNIQTQLNAITAGEGYKGNEFTLSPTDITNKYVTLSSAPANPTLTLLNVVGGLMQQYTSDFTVSGSTLSWSGLFLDGVLASGDILIVQFY